MSSYQTYPLLQNILTAPAASFARRRSYGYASSQGLTADTRQNVIRYRGEV